MTDLFTKEQLKEYLDSDPSAVKLVNQILNALGTAHVCGKCLVMPESDDSPVVLITYDKKHRDNLEMLLKAEQTRQDESK